VNRYLGYRAATELAAAPDYSVQPEQPGKRDRQPVAIAPQVNAPVAEADPLKAALARLGRAVARRGF
jgi:hypothetical protein